MWQSLSTLVASLMVKSTWSATVILKVPLSLPSIFCFTRLSTLTAYAFLFSCHLRADPSASAPASSAPPSLTSSASASSCCASASPSSSRVCAYRVAESARLTRCAWQLVIATMNSELRRCIADTLAFSMAPTQASTPLPHSGMLCMCSSSSLAALLRLCSSRCSSTATRCTPMALSTPSVTLTTASSKADVSPTSFCSEMSSSRT
mmetsp:Transcript_16932/g.41358  ORF Transcript_16932/g.41358 Transcript_16932/m.41358 type:complete len:206 (-) Transcript_16932:953-1570(-)